jgi:hypothetical protein
MLNKDEALKLAHETLEKELAHYLDKLWKIFSWASTILVSIIGGVIALRFRDTPIPLSFNDKVSLTVAVLVLSIHAIGQLSLLLSFESKVRNKLEVYNQELGLDQIATSQDTRTRPDTHPLSKWFGYIATIFLLMLAAIYTIVFGS